MSIHGETDHIGTECMMCGKVLTAKVLKSGAGYYIGTFCLQDGPYSRESGYYSTKDEALTALKDGTFGR